MFFDRLTLPIAVSLGRRRRIRQTRGSRGGVRGSLLVAAVALGLSLLPLLPRPTDAQVIRGRVLDPSGTGPVEGAMVMLLDRADRRRGATLSNATGAFRLEAPGPGRYRLRADRIGYRSTYSDFVDVARGDTVFLVLESEVDAIPLAGIDVEGSGRCRVRGEEGLATARVWEEVRKALAAAEWTDDMGLYRYRLLQLTRVLDRRGRDLEPPDSTRTERYLRTPFHAESAEQLVSNGFVQLDGEEHVYFGPDAAVLLSDVFLDTHCMRLREGRDGSEGLLGLAFEPVEDRGVPDIRGTLWLDPDDSELRWLEYEYVELESVGIRGDAGGRVVFEGLPNGTWIVRDWEIHMPLVDARRRRRVVGARTGGGTVIQVRDQAGRIVLEQESGTVSGVVVDSTGAEPAADAVVRVVGVGQSARTDADGVFYISGLEEGVHHLRATTPLLLGSGWEGEEVAVEVRRGEIATVRLRIPSAVTAAVAFCARGAASEDSGVVMGTVSDRTWDAFLAGVPVRARWGGSAAAPTGAAAIPLETGEARTDAAGKYILCGVPLETPVTLEVGIGEKADTAAIQLLGDSRVLVRDFRISAGGGSP